MIVRSPAKLNLYLGVINQRVDNYHNIKTVFERITLSDTVILKARRDKKIIIHCAAKAVPKDKTNLAWQAAKLLQKFLKQDRGIDITIVKRIPVGAGLGGGSSNAASVLLGLNKLWGLGISRKKLAVLAAGVGSDVAFFIHERAFALGSGRGEKIKLLPGTDKVKLWHILVVPKLHVSTPYVYKKWDAAERSFSLTPSFLGTKKNYRIERAGLTRARQDVKILLSALKNKNLRLLAGSLFNGLERVSFKLYPRVRELKRRLGGLGVEPALMSGSGPAVFGIVASKREAVSLRRKLESRNGSEEVFVVRTF